MWALRRARFNPVLVIGQLLRTLAGMLGGEVPGAAVSSAGIPGPAPKNVRLKAETPNTLDLQSPAGEVRIDRREQHCL